MARADRTGRARRMAPALLVVVLVAVTAGAGGAATPPAIGPGSVGQLQPVWSAALPDGPTGSTPVVAGGRIHLTSGGKLLTFDAAGSAGCGGTPKVCKPLWVARGAGTRSPAVGSGVVVVTEGDALLAFDAEGAAGCSGTPKICSPVWRATVPDAGRPAIAGGRVFVGSDRDEPAGDPLFAFDARGTTGCSGSPKVCLPLWRSAGAAGASPVVANGIVYASTVIGDFDIGRTLRVTAFDATGATGCSGTPRRCTPRWVSDAELFDEALVQPPSVAEGRVYVELTECCHMAMGFAQVIQYAATPGAGCTTGTPRRCPLLDAALADDELPYIFPPAAGGGGRVFVGGLALQAYARDGLAELWRSSEGNGAGPALANGVVYTIGLTVSGSTATVRAVAYDAAGARGCSGAPTMCTPLWRSGIGARVDWFESINSAWATPAVANGTVYVRFGRLQAFRLPGT